MKESFSGFAMKTGNSCGSLITSFIVRVSNSKKKKKNRKKKYSKTNISIEIPLFESRKIDLDRSIILGFSTAQSMKRRKKIVSTYVEKEEEKSIK